MPENCAAIVIAAKHHELTKVKDTRGTTNTIGALRCKFQFRTDDWLNSAKTAMFCNGDAVLHPEVINDAISVPLDIDDECPVPQEVLTDTLPYSIGVWGVTNTGLRVVSNWLVFNAQHGCYAEGNAPADPEMTVYEEILLISKDAVDIANEVLDRANNGEFKGEKGDKGDKGEKGDTGDQGIQGEKGDKGDTGAPGANGKDGYTPIKGIDYFDGAKGDKGDKGDTGAKGDKGDKGDSGYTPRKGVDYFDGDQGEAGADGIGITKSEINANGELVLTYSNKETINLGKVVGSNGTNGIDGKDGVDGKDGADGADGADGYTPIRGTDYWTEADKAEIKADVVAMVGDIDSVLDAIIAKQTEVLGGDT